MGKSGSCGRVFTDSVCKMISMYLQSPEPRYKIIKKFKKQFVDMKCGQPFDYEGDKYSCCIDYIIKCVIGELEKQI